jgi:hypothetical protein
MRFEYCNTLQRFQASDILLDVPGEDIKDHPLYPLTQGKPLVLLPHVKGKIYLKRRNRQAVYPTLWMAPVSLFGLKSDHIMISIPVYGSIVVSPWSVKALDLWQTGGMSMQSCQTLAWHLQMVFQANTAQTKR